MAPFRTILPPMQAAERRPSCPTCGAAMRLIWIAPDKLHCDRHTLECMSCGHAIELVVSCNDNDN